MAYIEEKCEKIEVPENIDDVGHLRPILKQIRRRRSKLENEMHFFCGQRGNTRFKCEVVYQIETLLMLKRILNSFFHLNTKTELGEAGKSYAAVHDDRQLIC